MADRATFLERAERLISQLAAERQNPDIMADRGHVIGQLRTMIAQASDGSLPPREERQAVLARLVVDQWPLGHPLANEVGEVEALYLRL